MSSDSIVLAANRDWTTLKTLHPYIRKIRERSFRAPQKLSQKEIHRGCEYAVKAECAIGALADSLPQAEQRRWSMFTTTTNLSLLERLRGGDDQRAWREFVRAYSPMLMAFAKRLGLCDCDADDAVQETLLAVHAVFRDMDRPFDRSKGRFKAWLGGVAKHKVSDVRRRQQRAIAVGRELNDKAAADAAVSEMDELFEIEWRRNLLARALERVAREVDPAVFQAFELYAVQGQSPGKVARLLDISRNAVYISKTRVLKRVSQVVAELREQEE